MATNIGLIPPAAMRIETGNIPVCKPDKAAGIQNSQDQPYTKAKNSQGLDRLDESILFS
jgi:hypothetical protein